MIFLCGMMVSIFHSNHDFAYVLLDVFYGWGSENWMTLTPFLQNFQVRCLDLGKIDFSANFLSATPENFLLLKICIWEVSSLDPSSMYDI